MTNSKLMVAALAALSLTAGNAFAEDEGDPCGGDPCGDGGDPCGGGEGMADGSGTPGNGDDGMMEEDDGGGTSSLVTPKGMIAVHVGIGIGMSKDLAGKPISITPDIFYGVAPKLEVGLAHSGHALTGFWGDNVLGGVLGTGVCVTGEDGGCASVYNGPVGLLARYSVMEGSIDLAVDGGPVIRALDSNGGADGGDLLLGFKVGVRGRKLIDKISIGFAPNITVGLNTRDGGNEDVLAIPLDVYFGVNDKIAVGLQTGIEGALSEFGDNFVVPLTVGGMFKINENMSAGAAFTLHRVTGGGETDLGAADLRSLGLIFGWHN